MCIVGNIDVILILSSLNFGENYYKQIKMFGDERTLRPSVCPSISHDTFDI